MPLLLVALITHVIYKAMTKGWDWGSDTSRKAWSASMAGSAALADRIRQRMADKLAEWDSDPRARGYAAFAIRSTGKIGKGLGKAGLWTLLKGARAAGAVTRALGGGVLATSGLLGALAQSTREGALAGTEWWRRKARRRSSRAERWAERLWNWGRTVPGQAEPASEPQQAEEPQQPNPSESSTSDEGPGTADPEPEPAREPYRAGEATVGDPPTPPRAPGPPTPIGQDGHNTTTQAAEPESREPYLAGQASTLGPTPVGSGAAGSAAAGTATAVIDQERPAIEGEIVSNALATTDSSAVAPISSPADGLAYEQAQGFLAAQAGRAQQLAGLAEQIHALQKQLMAAAAVMQRDHEQAQAALARFNVSAPAVGDVIGMLASVAGNPAPEADMVTTYMALEAVTSGCNTDKADLQNRFGTAWEIMRAENAKGEFLNN